MNTFRRILSALNQGRKRVWKTVKKNCSRIGRRNKSRNPTKCTVELFDGVTDEIMVRHLKRIFLHREMDRGNNMKY